MARSTWTNSNPTDAASAKAWAKSISDAFIACGLTRSSDTGQINWTTATFTISATNGYEVFYLNDALHATKPIYLKVEYVTGAGYFDYAGLTFSIGSATNGAGTLTAFSGIPTLTMTGTYAQGTSIQSWCGGDGSGIALNLAAASGTPSCRRVLILDRTRDATGAITGAGFLFAGWTGGAAFIPYYYSYDRNAVSSTSNAAFPVTYPYLFSAANASALTAASEVPVVPVVALYPAPGYSKMVGLCATSDVAAGAVIPVSWFGSTADMVRAPHPGSTPSMSFAVNGGVNSSPLLYYGA